MSKSYGDRLNQEFQKLGARGVSILVASGDRQVPDCLSVTTS